MSSERNLEKISPNMDEDHQDAVNPQEFDNSAKPSTIVRSRIFMNQVDQYNARHLAEYLTDQVMGALKAAGEAGGEGEEEEPPERVAPTMVGDKYEVIGTLKFPFGRKTEDILYSVSESDAKVFEHELLNSSFVVYDITKDPNEIPKALAALDLICDQIENVRQVGPKTFSRYERVFVFVLISNVMSWAKTKPIDPDDPETPFTEADYRKRKPNPNYMQEISCEREVILRGRKYKENLKTYVICTGIPYGFEEDDLFLLFKLAWLNKDLPIFGPGTNTIPLIHIQDLAKVLHAVLEMQPKKPNYILAVEQIPCKLAKVVRALSKSMGRGVHEISKENAFLYNNMTQRIYDLLTVNLKMEPAYIIDELAIEYRNDMNLAQNMNSIVREFRIARNLNPLKILVHGPLCSGKTTLSKALADYYGVHYITVGSMIKEICDDLREKIDEEIALRKAKLEKPPESAKTRARDEDDDDEEGGEEAMEEEEAVDLESLQQRLADIETTLERSPDRKLPDDYVIRLMRTFLVSNLCQNQGYVLDGYPETMEQTRELFGWEFGGDGGGGEGGEGEPDDANRRSILPQTVISIEATDDFLIRRVMNMEEKFTQGTHYEESAMINRLKRFRDNNTEENTLLNFFDEHEIHPHVLNGMDDKSDPAALFRRTQESLGSPVGFEASAEEQEEMRRCQLEAEALKQEQERIENEISERKQLEEYQNKMEERIRVLDDLQMEEEKLLTVQCEPLRNYLMSYVFPTLTQGLLEVARIKPKDPVDYLAEYLFKTNPEGKMFDPTYTRQGELIEQVTRDITIKKTRKRLSRLCK